ncbi:proton-translocating NADH-quinone oxidoreductase subunit N [Tumebacillus algifaecis]|uniref:NADH-quinone oxidoreductase subunit N n=1 Tax=Tumebacillus algifaecis TaxID=1214604 RepID=A0A223CXC5_9BACL|nr:NADH-quinone oxidoreductase subunit N [Tumebacillus algifaecis]ASS73865.1 proton-translocating NADH-quinone oxidoreductase subunit N [Tumebacillus algifaecis]
MNPVQSFSTLSFTGVWEVMAPEVILVLLGFGMLVFDLFVSKETSRRISPWIGVAGLLLALVLVLKNFGVVADGGMKELSNMLYVLDDYGNIFKVIFILGTTFTLLMSIDFFRHNPQVKVAEYSYLLIFATVGAMVMSSAYDLITLFVGLELLSIASYILVAIRRDAKGGEGAMKYLITGSIATAFALYGMSFLYGVTGVTNIAQGSQMIAQMWVEFKPLIVLAFLLMTIGFGAKIALAPFHMWAPDTYEGAPNPITSFLSVVSKAAGFALVFRLFIWGFGPEFNELYIYLVILAAITMVIGNVAALVQKNIKRLLAYSSVAQAGYLLIPLAVLGNGSSQENIWLALGEVTFYLAAYLLMTMGAFAILTNVTRAAGTESLDAFRGLYKRSPFQALAMTVFVLSMAGMPITAGFFGKFYIFLGAINTQMYWLAALLFVTSAIAFYYYFGVLKAIYMKDSEAPVTEQKLALPWSLGLIAWVGMIGTVVLGVYPTLLLDVLNGLNWFGL